MLKEISCHDHFLPAQAYIPGRIPLSGVAHQNVTLRFGIDPQMSVLDINCKTHDLENLYVVDRAFFPLSGTANPALTIMANALGVGEHIRKRLG